MSGATGFSTGSSAFAPQGHGLRRAMTVNDTSNMTTRRRSSADQEPPFIPRRSSLLSDSSGPDSRRSLRNSTGDILNPFGTSADATTSSDDSSSTLRSLPLVFAVLPALAGALFQNGSSVVADVLLLGVACIILRWTVTQPWQWYRAAQQTRIIKEDDMEHALADDSEEEAGERPPKAASGGLHDVPEEAEGADAETHHLNRRRKSREAPMTAAEATGQQEKALKELYLHEGLSLFSCFLCPILGAYLLHTIRGSLSRPSEGLVSDFNVSIFLLAAELHPLSHALKLVQARTLHLQKTVTAEALRHQLGNSDATSGGGDASRQGMGAVLARLNVLEERLAGDAATDSAGDPQNGGAKAMKPQQDVAFITREVRGAIQPELEALNRAVRRYEKKATVLAFQTEARLGQLDARLNDALALAAVAAKNSTRTSGILHNIARFFSWVRDSIWMALMWPIEALVKAVMLPLRAVTALFGMRRNTSMAGKDTSWTVRRTGTRFARSDPDREWNNGVARTTKR